MAAWGVSNEIRRLRIRLANEDVEGDEYQRLKNRMMVLLRLLDEWKASFGVGHKNS